MIHSNSVKNHKIENWTYANAAARTGATGFTSADIGKLAYQTDQKSYWRLTATTPTWDQAMAGPAGADGADGADGAAGATGSVWRNGSGVPSNALGIDNDYYVDTDNGDVYFKSAGTYSVILNITGPAGAPGADGADGLGPAGGTTGQIATKASNADQDIFWNTPPITVITNETANQASGTTDGSFWTITGDQIGNSTLVANGQKVHSKYAYTAVGHATATRQWDIKIGLTTLWTSPLFVFPANVFCELEFWLMRVGTNTARFLVRFTASDGQMDVYYGEITGLTFTSSIILNTEIAAGGAGAAMSDIVMKFGSIWREKLGVFV